MTVAHITLGAVDGDCVVATDAGLRLLRLPLDLLAGAPCVPGAALCVAVSAAAPDAAASENSALLAAQRRIRALLSPPLDARTLSRAPLLSVAAQSHTAVALRWPAWPRIAALARGLATPDQALGPGAPSGDWAASAPHLLAIEVVAAGRAVPAVDVRDTGVRLTGLPPNTALGVRLRLRTAAGVFLTNSVEAHTLPLTELSCLCVSVLVSGRDAIDKPSAHSAERDAVESNLHSMGAAVVHGVVDRNTTHVVLIGPAEDVTDSQRQLLTFCSTNHIPVVAPAWVTACLHSGKMQSVSRFYALT